ncbi:MAG TPA: RNA pseudouridine synthase [Myxococcota bacterium]|nr:RNA pseudouridine synthase [Myxococcota bacterium]
MSLANPSDPPLLRQGWVTDRRLSRAELLDDLRLRLREAGWSSERIASLLWHGGVHLAGHPFGEEALPNEVAARTSVVAYAFAYEPAPVPLPEEAILWDASGVVAVNKPAWMTVQATRASQRLSLEAALRKRLDCRALTAVHRLDRGTSGIVLFARNRESAARLGRELAGGRLQRRYLALVSPRPWQSRWEVSGFLARTLHPTRFRFALYDAPGARRRESRTRFVRLGTRDGSTLVLAEPATGRTHQIRVHLAHGGTPIVGDTLYGSAAECAPQGFPLRTQLHAIWLRVRIDATPGVPPLELAAPTPYDFAPAFARANVLPFP